MGGQQTFKVVLMFRTFMLCLMFHLFSSYFMNSFYLATPSRYPSV